MRDAEGESVAPFASRVPEEDSTPVRRLTCLFAHPDDETFAVGGTVARYAREGVECHLYCATDGDAGRRSGVEVGGSREALGRRRREELARAARILGFASVHHGAHGDGVLGAVDGDLLVGELVAVLRATRPQVVLTFGPEGAPNAHRDHRAISRAATAAFFLAGNPSAYPEQLEGGREPWRPVRLLYATWKTPAEVAGVRVRGLPIDVVVDVAAERETKREAFRAHETQRDHEARFEELALGRGEAYALAAGRPFPERAGGAPARDLFEGLLDGL